MSVPRCATMIAPNSSAVVSSHARTANRARP
jgi:hypothetical protein